MGNEVNIGQHKQVHKKAVLQKLSYTSNEVNKNLLFQQPNFLHQQYDNPSRKILNNNFLKTTIHASKQKMSQVQDILIIDQSAQYDKIDQIQKFSIFEIQPSEVTIGKYDSYESNQQNSDREDLKDDESQVTQIRDRKISLELNVGRSFQEAQIKRAKTEEILNSLSEFILTQKNMAEPIKVNKQNFIKFKKQDIRLMYDFIQKVGEGTYGTVYKIVSKLTRQIRAVKILKRTSVNKEQQKRLISEIQILKRIDHPNIIKIFEVFIFKDTYYIVTQYCEGGSLATLINQSRIFTLQSLKIIFRQILSALAYIHRLNIVHRDIKCQNIILANKWNIDDDVNKISIKIIDFGLSKCLQTKVIKDRERIGTTSYMAPEVMNGVYSTKCDVWSAGILLYFLIAGHNPFQGKNRQHTIQNIKKNEVIFKEECWKFVDFNVKDFILKMLTKNYSHRIQPIACLNHPFLAISKDQQYERQMYNQVSKKLYDYHRGNNLVSVIESFISFTCTTQVEIYEFSKIFQLLDKNNDGLIEKKQLEIAFQKSGHSFSKSEIHYVLSKVDKNHSGKIDYSQFVTMLSDRNKLFATSSLITAFKYIDSDNSGFLEKNELQQIMKLGNVNQIDNILSDIDQNNDNRISQDQFVKYIEEGNFL